MSVHYKFKAALEYSTVTFDGIHISVLDLKNAIIDQKKLAKNADSDLQIINAQTKEIYDDDAALIPKNTSVIVARVPLAGGKRSNGGGGSGPPHLRSHQNRPPVPNSLPSSVAKGGDLITMDGTEEEKIQAMMSQSTADYDPTTYAKIRGAYTFGRIPQNYRCYKCNKSGHWIRDCPLPVSMVSEEVKKSTGIPRSFMVTVDGPETKGALITPDGRYAVPAVDHAAYLEKNKPAAEPPVPKPEIPDTLLCNLCQDLLTDALLVPCCANSYCDDCIRSALLESEEQECPGCHEKEISPTSLIPNRFLRSTVNAFKNETGYSKPQKVVEPVRVAPPTVDLTLATPTEPQRRKLSLDELPEDLFPHSPRKTDTIDVASDKTEKAKEVPDSEQDDKTDLYYFNDGSIPSPFNAPSSNAPGKIAYDSSAPREHTISTIDHSKPPIDHSRPSGARGSFHRTTKTPLHSEMPPIPTGLHNRGEPPPPGFEEFVPRDERNSPSHRDDRVHRGHPDDRHGLHHNGPHSRSLLSMPMPGVPFNPNQPPPGFPGMGPPMFGGIPVCGPGPGPMHPNSSYSYHPNFRGPPPSNFGGPPQMYGGPQHPGDRYMNDRNRRPPMKDYQMDRGDRDRLRERDDSRDKDRMHERSREDVKRPEEVKGVIADPLEEFERLMREKDLRKQQQALAAAAPPPKRSRSRSFSPTRRTPSPFLKQRQRTSYSRSPSPKRKRLMRRRNSYSRSRSRSPGVARRIRSRSRNRTPSLPPGTLPLPPKRRSPRRAPPFSPSPPPARLPPRNLEKDEYFEKHHPPRFEPSRHESSRNFPREYEKYEGNSGKYDSGPPKFDGPPLKYESGPKFDSGGSNSKYHEGGPKYEGKYDSGHKYESGSKYDSGSSRKYEGGSKYDSGAVKYESGPRHEGSVSKYESGSKYESSTTKYESTAKYDRRYETSSSSKHDGKYEGSSKHESKYDASNKYEGGPSKFERERDTPKKYERSSAPRGYPQHGGDQTRSADFRRQDRDRDREARPLTHEFDQSLMPPGTEQQSSIQTTASAPVSLFDLKLSKPHGLPVQDEKSSYYNPAVSPPHTVGKQLLPPSVDRERELDSLSLSLTPESDIRAPSHHRRKSGEGKDSSPSKAEKKIKKEKRKHKKKSRDEKDKDKKSKKKRTKTGKSGEIVQETEESESGCSRRNSAEAPSDKNDAEDVDTNLLPQPNGNAKIAALCDSTVKSPEHLNDGPGMAMAESEYASAIEKSAVSFGSTKSAGVSSPTTETHIDPFMTTEGLDDMFNPGPPSNVVVEKIVPKDKVKDDQSSPIVSIPPSKWDKYDDDHEGVEESSTRLEFPSANSSDLENTKIDKTVTTEVIKRAENVLFHKPIGSVRPNEVKKSPSSRKADPSPESHKEPEVRREARRANSSIQITVATASLEPVPENIKRSVKDRLGSKVSEELARDRDRDRGEPKESPGRVKSLVSVSRSSDRDRERERDKEREREREREKERERERDKERDRAKEKDRRRRTRSPRSPIRLIRDPRLDSRARMVIELRPRSRNRSPFQRDFPRTQDDRVRRRTRSRSPRTRVRSPIRLQVPSTRERRRTRSPVRVLPRRRSPSPSLTRMREETDSRGWRDQERERERDRRDSPSRSSAIPPRSRDEGKISERERKLPGEDEKEPSPPGVSPKTLSKAEEEENWKVCSDKFVPIGFAPVSGERSYTPPPPDVNVREEADSKRALKPAPVPLAVRKQKGRINIKLSSTSKAEENESSSSTSDEEGDGKSSTKIRSSIESDTEKRKRKDKREKKKAKRRKSNSSSSSSSDSEERKKRKAKKKKKKSKKKKKAAR